MTFLSAYTTVLSFFAFRLELIIPAIHTGHGQLHMYLCIYFDIWLRQLTINHVAPVISYIDFALCCPVMTPATSAWNSLWGTESCSGYS